MNDQAWEPNKWQIQLTLDLLVLNKFDLTVYSVLGLLYIVCFSGPLLHMKCSQQSIELKEI